MIYWILLSYFRHLCQFNYLNLPPFFWLWQWRQNASSVIRPKQISSKMSTRSSSDRSNRVLAKSQSDPGVVRTRTGEKRVIIVQGLIDWSLWGLEIKVSFRNWQRSCWKRVRICKWYHSDTPKPTHQPHLSWMTMTKWYENSSPSRKRTGSKDSLHLLKVKSFSDTCIPQVLVHWWHNRKQRRPSLYCQDWSTSFDFACTDSIGEECSIRSSLKRPRVSSDDAIGTNRCIWQRHEQDCRSQR